MCILNQVAGDHQLLKTARDYFQFVTNFFEVISVSATHIYHSALELSPLSSIVRKLYYSQRPHPSPRVVVGNKDSWGKAMAASSKNPHYLASTWSPCGQFVAVVAETAVEIWDALTLKPLSTLHPANIATKFRHGITYSPDGHSLAACSNAGIVIWDIQTGGEVTKIPCEVTSKGLTLVWSLDGMILGAISPWAWETITVHTCDIYSGTTLSSSTLQSRIVPYLWAHDTSFQIVTTAGNHKGQMINIFEVGSALTRIESFPLQIDFHLHAFSPTTYRAVFTTRDQQHGPKLLISNIRNSKVLLETTGLYQHLSFSPDAGIVAASARDCLFVWTYDSGQYTQQRKFEQAPGPLQFSPTSSSILSHAGALLHIINLDYPPPAVATESTTTIHNQYLSTFSPHGTFAITGHPGRSTITITNLSSQNPFPSQFIDTGLKISAMILTGNVLLVKGSEKVVAWLLTEEGVVDGIFGNTRADHNDSLWEISPQTLVSRWARLLGQQREIYDNVHLEFSVEDGVGAIKLNELVVCVYHTETGEILKSDETSLHLQSTWYQFEDKEDLYHHDLCKHTVLESDWPVSQTTLQEGWVKDPEGKHRLWLHSDWRSAGNDVHWIQNATTLRLRNSSGLAIIKF